MVSLEEGKLLEKPFPADLVALLLVFHYKLRDFHRFFYLGYHHVTGGKRYVVG